MPLTIPDPLDVQQVYIDFRAKITELSQADPPLAGNELELFQMCRALFCLHFNEVA